MYWQEADGMIVNPNNKKMLHLYSSFDQKLLSYRYNWVLKWNQTYCVHIKLRGYEKG